jgi:hypothetical protein
MTIVTVSHKECEQRINEAHKALAKALEYWRETLTENQSMKAENLRMRTALLKVRSYNLDIEAGRINYRPRDHIQVIDEALVPRE